jgi:hypothetical protein
MTGFINGRLQTVLLAEETRLDSNQGANRKGVNLAHKAAVLYNVLADAKRNDAVRYAATAGPHRARLNATFPHHRR